MTSRNRRTNPSANPNQPNSNTVSIPKPRSLSQRSHPSPQTNTKSAPNPTSTWDTQNHTAYTSIRSQMLSCLSTNGIPSKPAVSKPTMNSYTRSQSTSAVYDTPRKELVRAQSTAVVRQFSNNNNNNSAHTNMSATNNGAVTNISDLLPVNEEYFAKCVGCLFDTPSPLWVKHDTNNNKLGSGSNNEKMVHIRPPKENEVTFLITRIYLRSWFEWARCTIVNSTIQRQSWAGATGFKLDNDSLRTLAALSIMAEQYQLHGTNTNEEWNNWFASLAERYKRYKEFGDEKKDEEDVFLPTASPGAVDGRILSCSGSPLLLRRNVVVMGGNCGGSGVGGSVGGSEGGEGDILTPTQESKPECLIQFLQKPYQKLAVCPVSSSFYELIRSTLGVICEDGECISFQPTKPVGAMLYYKQACVVEKREFDIAHPSAASTTPTEETRSIPRPIEFARKLLPTTLTPNDSTSNMSPKKMSSYSKLMKEAMTCTPKELKSCVIELFPVEFRYVILDSSSTTTNAMMNSVNSSPIMNSSHGIALISRTTLLSEALNDFKRAVESNRSSSCVRLWRKSPGRGATAKGDGYDLIDSALFESTDSKNDSTKGEGEEMTVEKWLHLEKEEVAVVELLVEVRSGVMARWGREALELENRLQVGDYVDAQDTALKWYEAIVRELTPETVKVHYFGWGSRWDGELPRRKGMGNKKVSPPMPLWSKTSRWRERIKIGQEVEVRQTASLAYRPKWYRATVIGIRREADSPIEIIGGAELEMIGEDKKSPLKLLQRKRQILVRVPQEKNNCSSPAPVQLRQENGLPVVHPPYIRWIDLYGEEICEANTHINFKKQSDAPATVTYAMDSQRKQPVEVMKSFNNLHGAGFVRESLRGVPPAPGSVGLHNLGNSCYMNSILQCVNHISPITQYFLKGDYVKHVNKNNPLGSGGRVATAYASFLGEIWAGEYSILAPRLLKQTVGYFAPQFNNNYQHDSQEFCQYLMDGLHEDLNRVKDKPYVEHIEANGMKDEEAARESWKRHLLRHDSVFVDYTQGMHRSHLTCPSCGRESIKFDVYSSISLPLVPSKDRPSIPLKDCLDQFAAGEQLDEHNAWYCSRCKKHVCALKLITLWNTPDILVLHLKRFTFEKCPTHDGRLLRRKIEDKVDFPIDRLDLTPYILGPKHADAPPIYKLFGVSEHTGTTANSGHYTATVRNSKDGNWYRYNDSHVGSTSGDAAVTGGAYLLFYQREKGSLRWAGMERQMQMGGQDADGFTEVQGKKKKKNNG